jgi:hypothetical protein
MFLSGLNPAQVDDTAGFAPGTLAVDHLGNEYCYVQAGGTIAAGTSGTVTGGVGISTGTAPAAPSQSIVNGKYFWAMVRAGAAGTTGVWA